MLSHTQEGFHLIHNWNRKLITSRRSIRNICISLRGQGSVQILEQRIKTKSLMKKQGCGSPFDLLLREVDLDLWYIKERVVEMNKIASIAGQPKGLKTQGTITRSLLHGLGGGIQSDVSVAHWIFRDTQYILINIPRLCNTTRRYLSSQFLYFWSVTAEYPGLQLKVTENVVLLDGGFSYTWHCSRANSWLCTHASFLAGLRNHMGCLGSNLCWPFVRQGSYPLSYCSGPQIGGLCIVLVYLLTFLYQWNICFWWPYGNA